MVSNRFILKSIYIINGRIEIGQELVRISTNKNPEANSYMKKIIKF